MILPTLWVGARVWMLGRLVANGLLQAGAAVGTAAVIQRIVDDLLLGSVAPPAGTLASHFGIAVALVMAGALLRWRERIDREIMGQSYVDEVRRAMYGRLDGTPAEELTTRSRGAILLRFIGDLTALSQWVSMGFARLGVAAVTILATLALLGSREPTLVLVMAAVLAAGALVTGALGPRMDAAVVLTRRRRSFLANNITEKTVALPVVQAFGRRRMERRRLARQSRKLGESLIARARAAGAVTAVAEATGSLAMLAALFFGVFAVGDSGTTPGSVVALMAIIGLLSAPTRDLGKVYEYWRRGRISRDKIARFLSGNEPVAEASLQRLVRGPGRLQLVGVRLNDGRRIDARIRPGSRIALTGSDSAGPAELLRIMAGLRPPRGGRIRVDGQDLAALRRDSLHRAVAMVGPELPLVRGTVMDNVRFGRPQAGNRALERVSRWCGLAGLATRLPEGLATHVAEGGRNLSGSQRVIIALARALLPNPRLLLLEGIDLVLDDSVREILLRLASEFRGSLLLITRDPALHAIADTLWYLDGEGLRAAPGPMAGVRRTPAVSVVRSAPRKVDRAGPGTGSRAVSL